MFPFIFLEFFFLKKKTIQTKILLVLTFIFPFVKK